METLPTAARPYQKIGVFTHDNIPDGLRKQHTTKAGTWGLIKVNEGRLRLRIFGDQPEELMLSPEQPGIIPPQVPHEVEAVGEVAFYIEFWK